jgi:hypothetical protein
MTKTNFSVLRTRLCWVTGMLSAIGFAACGNSESGADQGNMSLGPAMAGNAGGTGTPTGMAGVGSGGVSAMGGAGVGGDGQIPGMGGTAGNDAAAGDAAGGMAQGGAVAGGAGGMDAGPQPLECTPMGEPPALTKTRIVGGLDDPTELIGLPDEEGVLWVLEHRPQNGSGHVKAIQNGSVVPESVLTVTLSGRYDGSEEGLLSIALHPDYMENQLVYVFYAGTDPTGASTVDEFRKTSATSAEFVQNVYKEDSSHHFHNGGELEFSPLDGQMYLSVGDNQANGGPGAAKQDEGLWGRILRINLQTGAGTTVHNGLRNPYRFSFDAQTGDMYIADVGEGGGSSEKLFFSPAGETGRNFGWNGSDNRAGQTYLDELGANQGGIIGGFVYRGSRMPGLCGRYFYGHYGTGDVWSLRVENGMAQGKSDHGNVLDTGNISSFGIDAQGEIYIVSLNGTVDRIDPAD